LIRVRFASAALVLAGLFVAPHATAAGGSDNKDWNVVGRQGLVRFVIVPGAEASDQAAYEREIGKLCEPGHTCFVNFYTNSTGVEVSLPLPDAIAHEATATYRSSMKNGVQIFMWSCRMKKPAQECF
jgi:hypothetical protein